MASDRMDSMRLELRRGLLVSAVLAALRVEQYGYSLRKVLAEAGLDIEEGTLYRRLEEYGLLQSRWSEGEGRRRRYYHISAEGEEVLTTLAQEWRALHAALQNLMGE
jgi:PadR family transcriptional regulator, regulatory protein PadR